MGVKNSLYFFFLSVLNTVLLMIGLQIFISAVFNFEEEIFTFWFSQGDSIILLLGETPDEELIITKLT